jgi:hypothetical protein
MAKSNNVKRDVFAVDGLNDTLKALRSLPKEANKELRAEVQRMTVKHAQVLIAAASSSPDSRVRGVAPTIRASKDRVPTVKLGGAKAVPVSRPGKPPRAGDIVFGTEFGADHPGPNAWRFPAKAKSYWAFRSLKGRQPQLVAEWNAAVDKVSRKWAD